MAGSPDEIGAAKVTSAQFHLASVPGTKAFAASPEDLSKKGYLEEEYYVTGTAARYRFPDPMNNAAVADGSYGYKTRMMVRRPADPAKFNGTVIAEWYNVTLGQDFDFNWATSREYFIRNGYAVVSILAQRAGVERLKMWSPARYGDLNVSAPNTTRRIRSTPTRTATSSNWSRRAGR